MNEFSGKAGIEAGIGGWLVALSVRSGPGIIPRRALLPGPT